MRLTPIHVLIASALAMAAIATAANSQQSTTATYADWVLQCQIDAGPPPKKICELTQVTQMQVQGKNQPFSRVLIQNVTKGQPVKLVVQLPVNVSLRAEVGIHISDSDALISVPFDHCLPGGCFAEFELKDDVLKKLYASEGGKVTFKDAAGKDVSVPLSFKGFRPAFDALSKG